MNDWNKDNKTIVSLQMGDTQIAWETSAPANDVPIEDLINAFWSQLVTFGYDPNIALESFEDFAIGHRSRPSIDRPTSDNEC